MRKKLMVFLCIFIFLFAFSIFKNISYPLLWNDEAETAMFADRILNFGYPKVHDGKNVLYLLMHPNNPELGINKKSDAYIGSGWIQYYYAVPGVLLAKYYENLYTKTAFMRIPFAVAGFLGIILLGLISSQQFRENTNRKLLFFTFFIFFNILSISLTLHLREVRYYSLVLLLLSCFFYLYFQHEVYRKISYRIYAVCIVICLVFIFNTFYPLYFILIGTMILYHILIFLKEMMRVFRNIVPKNSKSGKKGSRINQGFNHEYKIIIRRHLLTLSPAVISFVMLIPFIIFFKPMYISKEISSLYSFTTDMYIQNLLKTARFFHIYEYITPAIIIKGIIFVLYTFGNKNKNVGDGSHSSVISNFLSLFFLVYVILICKSPFFFERYFIVLIPTLIIIFLSDFFIIFDYLEKSQLVLKEIKLKIIFCCLVSLLFLICSFNKADTLKGHYKELFNQYKGVLDYAIPFIKSNFKEPEKLIIATNYEEPSYMYYLKSKVIIGYINNNIEEDLKIIPDIIIYRKTRNSDPSIFNYLLSKDSFTNIRFPVYDYEVNNTPELSFLLPHLFITKAADEQFEQLEMYVKDSVKTNDGRPIKNLTPDTF